MHFIAITAKCSLSYCALSHHCSFLQEVKVAITWQELLKVVGCRLKHVKMATMPRQQSTLLDEELGGDFLPRRGSDQNLVCNFMPYLQVSSCS